MEEKIFRDEYSTSEKILQSSGNSRSWTRNLEMTQAVKDAIDIGYRHIDGAFIYRNEAEVGEAVQAKIKEGVIKRQDIFLTSKLWNTFHRPEAVEPAIRTTLKNLGVDYVDLYLIHWPIPYKEGKELQPTGVNGEILFSDYDYVDTWKAMEKLYEKGLAKNIGVSNFNEEQLERVLKEGKIKPVTNQVECHPYLTQIKLSEYCKSKGITITAYCPLGCPDRPWGKPEDPKLLDDLKITSIAKKYKKSPAQVVLRYQVQRGHIVIPKSVNKSRIQENFNIFNFELSKEDIELINSFDCGGRICALRECNESPYYPFKN
ncbi:aldo-keto reductase family 1 member B1 isoform X2 [Neodiprion lecontei]|uniref:Aldo-keto reductase family 1 member B1 isoform X2 n=1 Tax=Neodiprion lecontei TaxID=441921 RepID=A0ABM3GHW4_NEOLC|nr:aldo-keto reductase family 1 member B1 isoform X2 [Neodiprion lecontei]